MENHQPAENQQSKFYNNPEDEDILPGFRFNPFDSELLDDYLLKLVYGENSPEGLGIPAVDLYCDAPQELTAKYEEHCEKQWYFFTKRNRKYSGGNRPNRGAGNGFWKQTNVSRPVFKVREDKTEVELGRKITLDYYDKSLTTAGERTHWKMNEYRVNDKLPRLPSNYSSAGSSTGLDEWCLCRIYISSRGNKTNNDGATSEEENDEQVPINAPILQQNAEQTIAAAAQEHSEQAVAEANTNFIPQNTAPFSSDQHIIAPQDYYGQNAGGLNTNSFQQSTNSFINNAFANSSNSYYFANTIDDPINWMSHNNDFGWMDHEESYPIPGQLHDDGFVQFITSLPATESPMLPYSNSDQSSSSNPGDLTRGPGDGSLASLVFGNGQSNSNRSLENGGVDQSGK